MKFSILGGVIASFSILAGCGGGGSASDSAGGGMSGKGTTNMSAPDFPGVGAGRVTEADFFNDYTAFDDIFINAIAPTPLSITSSSATFNGMVFLGEEASQTDGYLGRTTLNANFGAGTMTGSAGDFGFYRSKNNDPNSLEFPDFIRGIGGTLTLSNGKLAQTPAVVGSSPATLMQGNLTGSLDGGNVVVNADLGGLFYDDNGTTTFAAFGDGIGDGDGNGIGLNQGPSTIDVGAGPVAMDVFVIAN